LTKARVLELFGLPKINKTGGTGGQQGELGGAAAGPWTTSI